LHRRLVGPGTEDPETCASALQHADEELAAEKEFD
jgi:guanylate kinase